ncbi:MAG: hypothetical protein LBL50_03640 [Candidatus Margulisbacteria bacterium]|jgi:hypothetical protein|nr:hypothetical protein [Candidatus Margulisiibacteriota bacterium]
MTRTLHTEVKSGKPLVATDITDLTFFPKGSILMMDGSWTNGRGNWYICDGRDTPHGKTPDLVNLFIRGGATSGGTGGGSATLSEDNLPSHNHSLTGLTITGGGEHSHGVGTLAASSSSATHSHGAGTLAVTISGGTHGHVVTDTGHVHTYRDTGGGAEGVSLQNYHGHGTGRYTIDDTGRTVANITIGDTTGSHGHTATVTGSTATDGAAHGHGITGSTGAAGASPTISGGTIGNTGNNTAFAVVPAYYTMIYIKKMA